jgi:DNA (cytosine-5)-methyltransferase 1
MSDLKVVSLFAGIGGIDRGLELAGASTALLCELDPHARKILARHYPHAAIHNDVTELTADDCRAAGAIPGRTILTAGWPCQGNSVAGRRGGMDDPRSGLWSHVMRLLADLRPAWFVGENVPGLLSVNDGRDFGVVVHDLADLGYGFSWRVLDARHFGVPQRRRRVVIVGRLGNTGAAATQVLLEPEGVPGDPTAGIGPRPVPSRPARAGAEGSRVIYVADRTTSLKSAPGGADDNFAQGGHLVAFAENQRGELTIGSTLAALSTGGGKPGQGYPAVTDGVIVRTLSPIERERLQGYPDDWTAGQADVRRFTQLGNSVAVPVFEWVGRRLVAVDERCA